jgi:hypothetical protein
VPGICITFGYYPDRCDIRTGDISLTTLPDIGQVLGNIKTSEGIVGDWLYAPLRAGRPNRTFGLPKTHVLTHENADGLDHLEFLVWCFSFFVGMRLTTSEAGFLDATPIKPGTLTDFRLSNRDLGDAISLAESFWQKHHRNPRDVKRVIGIIHALFLSQYPPYLQFEEFTYLYIALDACYALAKSIFSAPPTISHAGRLEWICRRFGLVTPKWAAAGASKSTEVSAVRNDTLHEALFFEEPLGFAIYGGNKSSQRENVPLEMQALICRLLVALLGKPNCDYVTSPVNTRQIFGLDLS